MRIATLLKIGAGVAVAVLGEQPMVHAASAVAYDPATNIVRWGTGHETAAQASAHATRQCLGARGAQCSVILSCDQGGYGAFYQRRVNRAYAFGVVCGHRTQIAATMAARKECEKRLAIQLGGLPASAENADFEWGFIQRRLISVCPGLGNCRCGDGNSWFDPVRFD